MPEFIAPGRLRTFTIACYTSLGVSPEDAAVAAQCIVDADLEGQGSHGMLRLPFYARRIAAGQISAKPQMQVLNRRSASALLEAGNGLGPVAGLRGMDIACDLAADAGAGLCAVRGGNHLGLMSFYVSHGARRGFLALAFSNTPPGVAPPGGRRPLLGTNPIAAAIPTSGPPVVIDMATTQVARGRVLKASLTGQSIPPGWALDSKGHVTTDAKAALAGSMISLGGAKGFTLALLVEILTGVLAGAGVSHEVGGTFVASERPSNVGHSFLAIDPTAFAEGFTARVEMLCELIRTSQPADPAVPVRVPGDRRHRLRAEAEVRGVEVGDELLGELDKLAAELGVPRLRT